MPATSQAPKNPKSCFLNLSYTSGNDPSKIEKIITDYFKGRGFEVMTGRMAPAGENLDKGILQVIKFCGFGIVVYNEMRHNISYEWGIMDALDIPVIPFKDANAHIDLDRGFSDKIGTKFVCYAGDSDKEDIIKELEKSESLHAATENVEKLVEEQISSEETEETRAASKLMVQSNIPLDKLVIGEKKEEIKDIDKIIDALNNIKHLTAAGHFNKATAYYYAGRYKDAEKELRHVIKLNPDYANAHYNLGSLLKNLNRFDEAEEEYREAIRINPDYANAHNNLGSLLTDLNRFDEAEEEYREAIRINPDYANAHANLGILLQVRERPEKAKKEIDIAKELFKKQGREEYMKKMDELLKLVR